MKALTCAGCGYPDRLCGCVMATGDRPIADILDEAGLHVEEGPTLTDLSKPEGTVGRVRTRLRLVPNL